MWGKFVQPVGGGNPVVFGLAASPAVLALQRGAGIQRLVGLISLLAATVLLVLNDIHGGAAAIGGVLGLVLSRGHQVQSARRESSDRDDQDESR